MTAPRLSLRRKLLILALVLALLPPSVAGWRMIRITHDELKSVVNDELVTSVRQITAEIDDFYRESWLTSLRLIRNAIDSEHLGVEEKVSLLTSGIEQITDVVARPLVAENVPNSVLASEEAFAARLDAAGQEPGEALRLAPDSLSEFMGQTAITNAGLDYVAATDNWLLTLVLPLAQPLLERRAVLVGRIDLSRLRRFLTERPFANTGTVTAVDAGSGRLFDPMRLDLSANGEY